jgi:hypothetical protein
MIALSYLSIVGADEKEYRESELAKEEDNEEGDGW